MALAGVAIYCAFVLLVLYWSSQRVGAPLRSLQRAAERAVAQNRAFEPSRTGPLEVQQLTAHIEKLVASLEKQLARMRATVDAIPDTLLLVDKRGQLRFIKATDELQSLSPDNPNIDLFQFLDETEIESAARQLAECRRTGQSQQFNLLVRRGSTSRRLEARAAHAGGDQVLVVLRDLTEKLAAERRIRKLAYEDTLTGLLNRASITQRILDQVVEYPDTPFAVAFIDVDRFKRINDSLGHDVGDRVLTHVAEKIRKAVRFDPDRPFVDGDSADVPARIGGDEFMVLLRGIDSEQTAMAVGTRIVESIAEPLQIGDQQLDVQVSLGVALYPTHARTQAELFVRSDLAMYEQKRTGSGGCCLYHEDLGRSSQRRLSLEARLKREVAARR